VGPEFFAAHPVSELLGKTDYWLGQQGRLTHPMVLRPGASHYTPIGWDEAFALIADELNGLESRTRRCSTSPAVPQTTRRSCIS
jgi:anaerobic selenocysteine-containing dehydrogenase